MTKHNFRKAFSAYGIEAEYMIVRDHSLEIAPLAEFVLTKLNEGILSDEVELGQVAWSNELVCHVLEIKCSPPAPDLNSLDEIFHQSILKVNDMLKERNCSLLSTGMHPWMNPEKEAVLWSHGQRDIYDKYNEIFDCSGHGWSNLQSVHINLPFSNEEEFAKLHAAIRAVLPLIPFWAASSPFFEGHKGALADNRLAFYEKNQQRIPSIAGRVIPEQVFTFKEYRELLQGIYKDISPMDPDKILQRQWLNSRGAIVKFDVQAIEIRLMDTQESPYMDFCLVWFITETVKLLFKSDQNNKIKALSVDTLRAVYDSGKEFGAFELPPSFVSVFGIESRNVNEFSRALFFKAKDSIPEKYHPGLEIILFQGNLAKRMTSISLDQKTLYQKIQQNLLKNSAFNPS